MSDKTELTKKHYSHSPKPDGYDEAHPKIRNQINHLLMKWEHELFILQLDGYRLMLDDEFLPAPNDEPANDQEG